MILNKFYEVLNDTINYFILGDIQLLLKYKADHDLPDDLATELTTSYTGDEIVENGIIVPMGGIENYPYTVIFHSNADSVELLKSTSELQVQQKGYILKVENGAVFLFTWRILQNFTDNHVDKLLEYYRQQNRPTVGLANGWYQVEIFGGLTLQEIEIKLANGEMLVDEGLEPTFEFVFTPTAHQEPFTADINYAFKLVSTDY